MVKKDTWYDFFYFLIFVQVQLYSIFIPPRPLIPPIPASHPRTYPLWLCPCVLYTWSLVALPLFSPIIPDLFQWYQGRNQKIPWNKWKWEYNKLTPVGHSESSLKSEIISSMFSDHNAMKLEINHRKNTEKHAKTW